MAQDQSGAFGDDATSWGDGDWGDGSDIEPVDDPALVDEWVDDSVEGGIVDGEWVESGVASPAVALPHVVPVPSSSPPAVVPVPLPVGLLPGAPVPGDVPTAPFAASPVVPEVAAGFVEVEVPDPSLIDFTGFVEPEIDDTGDVDAVGDGFIFPGGTGEEDGSVHDWEDETVPGADGFEVPSPSVFPVGVTGHEASPAAGVPSVPFAAPPTPTVPGLGSTPVPPLVADVDSLPDGDDWEVEVGDVAASTHSDVAVAVAVPFAAPPTPPVPGLGGSPVPPVGVPMVPGLGFIPEENEWDESDDDVEGESPVGERRSSRARKDGKPSYGGRVSVTERDRAMIEFLARYRMATYPQLSDAFDVSYSALRRRLPRLASEGLVVKRPMGQFRSSAWLPTKSGMQLVGMDLTVPTLSWGTVAHTLGLVDIGIMFEAAGERVVTEREIRAADTREHPTSRMMDALAEQGALDGFYHDDLAEGKLYVVPMGSGRRQFQHIPDMVLSRQPGARGEANSIAVELELNPKPASQWQAVLEAYKNSRHIGAVVYFTHQARIKAGVLAAAEAVGAAHMVEVRPFEMRADTHAVLPD